MTDEALFVRNGERIIGGIKGEAAAQGLVPGGKQQIEGPHRQPRAIVQRDHKIVVRMVVARGAVHLQAPRPEFTALAAGIEPLFDRVEI